MTFDVNGLFIECDCILRSNILIIVPASHSHTYVLTPWSRVLLDKLIGSQLVKKFLHFMEPKVSLPHSQVPATYPYPEPAQSTPCPTSHFLKIYLSIILPSMPASSKWSLFFKFPHQNPVYTSLLPHTRYMPRPSHSSRFYHPKRIG